MATTIRCLRRWAAGVVVCFIDDETGEACLLFGKEQRQDGGYNIPWGFGEMREASPHETAARESRTHLERSGGCWRFFPGTSEPGSFVYGDSEWELSECLSPPSPWNSLNTSKLTKHYRTVLRLKHYIARPKTP